MEVCVAVENISNADASNDSSQCSSVNVSSEASVDYMVGECLKQNEGIEQAPKENTSVCHSICEVPYERKHSVRQSVYELYSKYDKDIVSPSYPLIVKSNALPEEILNLNDNSKNVCNIQSSVHDCDSHSDSHMSNAHADGPEKVVSEMYDLRSVGETVYNLVNSEKVTSQCSEGNDINSLDTNELQSLSEEIIIKNEIEEEVKEYDQGPNAISSKIVSQCSEDIVKNDLEFPTQCYEDQTLLENGSNNDSDNVSADEREEKDDTLQEIDRSGNTPIASCLTVCTSKRRKISSHSYANKRDKINASFSGRVLYKCIKCNFAHKKLEQLSSHVLTCTKKRKYGRNQAYRIDEDLPSKTCFLFTDSKTKLASNVQTMMTQSRTCTSTPPTTQQQLGMLVENPVTSQTQAVVLTHSHDPLTSKAQFIITPETRVLASPQSLISSPKTQLLSASNSQFVVASQNQLPNTQKAVYSITSKTPFTSSNSEFVISAQSQILETSKSQVTIATPVTTARTEITSTHTTNPFVKTTQPIVSLKTPCSTVSSAQFTSVSKPPVAKIPQATLSIPPGAKITIGPQTQIPIVPQAPLALSPQGNLTISQSGSHLLITTNPVQQNIGTPNKPTLLGLGIGTSPTVAPKNIVLLPNLLLNSYSSVTGTVNGKQESAPTQGQLIHQNATTPDCSAEPLQFQQNIVYSPQSLASQPQILMSPIYTMSNQSESSGIIGASTFNIMQQPKLSFTLSSSKQSSNTVSESTTNTKLSYQSGKLLQSFKSTTFICEICDDYVNDLEKLRNHMQCLHEINIHPKMMPSVNCQKCQYCFFTEQGLERHLVGSHGLVTAGMQEAADKGKDGGRCPICGWGYQNKLLHHVAMDHKVSLKPAELSYKCTLCTATFTMYKQFEDHVYTAHRPAITKLAQGNSQSSSHLIK